jgi:hypothetical protein
MAGGRAISAAVAGRWFWSDADAFPAHTPTSFRSKNFLALS